jgi:hypothetical protein
MTAVRPQSVASSGSEIYSSNQTDRVNAMDANKTPTGRSSNSAAGRAPVRLYYDPARASFDDAVRLFGGNNTDNAPSGFSFDRPAPGTAFRLRNIHETAAIAFRRSTFSAVDARLGSCAASTDVSNAPTGTPAAGISSRAAPRGAGIAPTNVGKGTRPRLGFGLVEMPARFSKLSQRLSGRGHGRAR